MWFSLPVALPQDFFSTYDRKLKINSIAGHFAETQLRVTSCLSAALVL